MRLILAHSTFGRAIETKLTLTLKLVGRRGCTGEKVRPFPDAGANYEQGRASSQADDYKSRTVHGFG